ncbi:MAG TPA: 50S ribosomal protein L11 methyltransferase [Burkholderiaceae bacterium]|nr:50S ribosomal protein L11 methyltransferase [Burkholderiaceae bacterium]
MRELVLHCLQAQAETLSDALIDAGALSVSVEDADSETPEEQALFGEPGSEPEIQAWRRNRVVALLDPSSDPEQLLEQVRLYAGDDILIDEWITRQVPDADWVQLTQAQFGPIQIGRRLWVVPSWHRDTLDVPPAGKQSGYKPEDAPIHIELDPGMAFGTGNHATTRLCLEWLDSEFKAGSTVLDYGCGSGILSIAAKKLGAQRTVAVDIDEFAVRTTQENAYNNYVNVAAMLPDELPEGQFDVVIANILSSPLKVLAPMLSNRVVPGGYLVLSGILEWQADDLALTYAPWIELNVWNSHEGWVCLVGQRPHTE